MRSKKPLSSRMHKRLRRNEQKRKENRVGRWRGKEWPWKKVAPPPDFIFEIKGNAATDNVFIDDIKHDLTSGL